MPTITEVPELTKEQQILQSFGVNPKNIDKSSDLFSRSIREDVSDNFLATDLKKAFEEQAKKDEYAKLKEKMKQWGKKDPSKEDLLAKFKQWDKDIPPIDNIPMSDAEFIAETKRVNDYERGRKSINPKSGSPKPMIMVPGPFNKGEVFEQGYRVNPIEPEYYPVSIEGQGYPATAKEWYQGQPINYLPGEESLMKRDISEGVRNVLNNNYQHYTDFGPKTKGMPVS